RNTKGVGSASSTRFHSVKTNPRDDWFPDLSSRHQERVRTAMMLPVPIRITQRALRGVLPTLLALGLAGFASHPGQAMGYDPLLRGEPLVVAQTEAAQLQVLLDEARQHLEAGRPTQALDLLEQAYQIDPNSVRVLQLRNEAMAAAERA